MSEASPLILIEPILRGSRLQVLANLISAIRCYSDRKIIIVTRHDYHSDHFDELLSSFRESLEVVRSALDLRGEWIKILSANELAQIFFTLRRLLSRFEGVRPEVVFMALDEYVVAFSRLALSSRLRNSGAKFYVVRYRVDYLLSISRSNFKQHVQYHLLRFLVSYLRATLLVFDERVCGVPVGGSVPKFLPDPWFGDFGVHKRAHGRDRFGLKDRDFVLLAVGRQDERKGIHLVSALMDRVAKEGDVRLLVIGVIDQEYAREFNSLKHRLGDRIVHVSSFVDEETLQLAFASADVCLLPYAKSFTSTSGTLARAAASGIPVLSGEHGLVGYRVTQYKLGRTFRIDDLNSFVDAFRCLRRELSSSPDGFASSLKKFALSCDMYSFALTVRNIFPNARNEIFDSPRIL